MLEGLSCGRADEEEQELSLWKKRLCLPAGDIDAIRKETCGTIFRTVSIAPRLSLDANSTFCVSPPPLGLSGCK